MYGLKNNDKNINIINVKMKSLSLPATLTPPQTNANTTNQALPIYNNENEWVMIPKETNSNSENEESEDELEYLKLNDTKYYIEKLLHKSMVSKVYLAHNKTGNNKEYCAVKIYLSDFKNQAKNEHKILTLLTSFSIPNIVEMIDVDVDKGVIVMPCYDRDLFDLIVQSQTLRRKFSSKSIKRYFTEIIDTIYKMHSNNIVHLDIKPENILISNDHHIKFIDFGFAKHVKDKKSLYCSKGTPFYAAPEIDDFESGYDPYKADIWSLGTTLYLMLELRRPFHLDRMKESSPSKVWKAIKDETLTFSRKSGKDYHMMISNMLKKDPNERWTINEVKAENDRINEIIKVKLT